MRDYKKAYSVILFTIHILWAVPKKVVHKRANYTLTETIIHKSLYEECAMKDEDYKQNGEWFFEIKKIVAIIKNIKQGYKDDEVKNVDGWFWWVHPEYENIPMRKTTRAIATKADVKSTLKGINVKDRTEFKREATARNYKE